MVNTISSSGRTKAPFPAAQAFASRVDDDLESPAAPLLDEETRRELLIAMLGEVSGLIAIYLLSDLRVVYLNQPASERFNPGARTDAAKLSLLDNVGLSSRQRLQAEILPQVRVLGRWSGECDLRDVWGGEFAVVATFRTHQSDGTDFLCMHAQERALTEVVNGTRFTDRQLLHALLEYVPDTIYFKDASSRFLRLSRSQAKKFGLSDPSEAIGKTDFDFFTAEHAGPAFADEQKILSTGEPILNIEEMETWEDGHVSWVATTKLPLYDAVGKIIGTFGVSHDITERKGSERSRQEMETQLQLAQKMESIGRLAAGVAHEINTPNQFITDNTHFLTDAFAKYTTLISRFATLRECAAAHPDCTEALRAIDAAEKEAEIEYLTGEIPRCLRQTLDGLTRVARIVCSLKEFAHPNSPDLTPADLNRAIETSLVVSRHEWKYVAEVATELDPNLPLVPCVVDEFNQVMLNLIINASHAIGDALKIRGGERGKITVRTRLEAPWAVLEVEDTGTGIPPEIRGRIFEPFFTTKATGKGTGQGLAIVQTVIVKHHHGTIDLKTEPGRGTTFIVKLPLELPQQNPDAT